jgi:hypothetical protein
MSSNPAEHPVWLRIQQGSFDSGDGTDAVARWDLAPLTRIRVSCVKPVAGPGVVYHWRILDRWWNGPFNEGFGVTVENAAQDNPSVGSALLIDPPAAERTPFAIAIECSVYVRDVFVGRRRLMFGRRGRNRSLRYAMFGETAHPDSAEGASYQEVANSGIRMVDRAQLTDDSSSTAPDVGQSIAQNWRGWTQALNEMISVVENLPGMSFDIFGQLPRLAYNASQPNWAAYRNFRGERAFPARDDHTHAAWVYNVMDIGWTEPRFFAFRGGLHEMRSFTWTSFPDPRSFMITTKRLADDSVDVITEQANPMDLLVEEPHWYMRLYAPEASFIHLPALHNSFGGVDPWLPVGAVVEGMQTGPGAITFQALTGAYLFAPQGTTTLGQGSRFRLIKVWPGRNMVPYGLTPNDVSRFSTIWELVLIPASASGEGGGDGGSVTFSGDVRGSAIAAVVQGLQGNGIDPIDPTANQTLMWDNGLWKPAHLPVGGEASGTVANLKVESLQGQAFMLRAPDYSPQAGHVLTYTGIHWTGRAAYELYELLGDVTGYPRNNSVIKLQGRTVSATAPTYGQVLGWNGSAWTPTTPASGAAGLAGDVIGDVDDNAVVRLWGRPMAATEPSAGQALTWSGTEWAPATVDVSALGGHPVASTAPDAGQVLTWSGTEWAPADASGGGGGSGDATTLAGRPISGAAPQTGQSLKWTGNTWAPEDSSVASYPVGSGGGSAGYVLTLMDVSGQLTWRPRPAPSGGEGGGSGDAAALLTKPIIYPDEYGPYTGQVLTFDQDAGAWLPKWTTATWQLDYGMSRDFRGGAEGPLTVTPADPVDYNASFNFALLGGVAHVRGYGTAEITADGLRLAPTADVPTSFSANESTGISLNFQPMLGLAGRDAMVVLEIVAVRDSPTGTFSVGDYVGAHIGFNTISPTNGPTFYFDGAFQASQVVGQVGLSAPGFGNLRLFAGANAGDRAAFEYDHDLPIQLSVTSYDNTQARARSRGASWDWDPATIDSIDGSTNDGYLFGPVQSPSMAGIHADRWLSVGIHACSQSADFSVTISRISVFTRPRF